MKSMKPLQNLSPTPLSLIATDMDGTLTHEGRFDVGLLRALTLLQSAGIPVVIVTGRSAGWVSGLAHYLPVTGAIAENGGVFFQEGRPEYLVEIGALVEHRRALAEMFWTLRDRFPQIRESSDNAFRQTDWTFEVAGLGTEELLLMAQMCEVEGWGFTYSTVQCHIMHRKQNKALGLKQVLEIAFPQVALDSVVTVGDSPNDESLFTFTHSVGVANVKHYVDQLTQLPSYVTEASEGEGFCELVAHLLG